MRKITALMITFTFLAILPAFAVTSVNFSTLPERTWVHVETGIGHIYGMSEVSWTYDRFNKKFVRVGGCTGGYTNEVYAYHFDQSGTFVSEQILAPGSTDSNRPGLGCNRGICYDSKRHIIWNYGGLGSPPAGVTMSGTNWALMGLDLSDNSWRMAPGSDAVQLKQACQIEYDPDHDAIILFGNNMGGWSVCYLYEFSTSQWRQIGSPWLPSSAKGNAHAKHLTYDPDNQVFVVLMGTSGDPQTWVFNPATMTDWEVRRPDPSPPFRAWPAMAYDPVRHKLMLHGGDIGDWDGLNDTWTYNAGTNTWTQITDPVLRLPVTGSQTQARCPAWDYDSEHDAMVMMCPQQGGVWVYRPGAQTSAVRSAPALSPAAFSIRPNPLQVGGTLNLDTKAGFNPARFEIFSVTGALLGSSGKSSALPTRDLAVGVYLLRAHGGAKSWTGRFLIQR